VGRGGGGVALACDPPLRPHSGLPLTHIFVHDRKTTSSQAEVQYKSSFAQVKAYDWKVALSRAPAPCSQRQASAALGANVAAPLPHFAAPLLLPALHGGLEALTSCGLPLTPLAAAASGGGDPGLEGRLVELGAVLRTPLHAGRLLAMRD